MRERRPNRQRRGQLGLHGGIRRIDVGVVLRKLRGIELRIAVE
jgi:hypothetical protein